MKTKQQKDTKERYETIVKLVKKARKTAEKFISENKHIDSQLHVKYS